MKRRCDEEDRLVDEPMLRYCRQVVLKAMDAVRSGMRGSRRLTMREIVEDSRAVKAEQNLTKAIDRDTEELMLAALATKLLKIDGVDGYEVLSEELGITVFPPGTDQRTVRWVVFADPIDGTEFAENLQGGWCLLALYDRTKNETSVAVAGDIFLDRLYWASRSGEAEGLDFITHSWFRLDGGPNPRSRVAGARVNVLMTKVGRLEAVAHQRRLLRALDDGDGRLNLDWGSNLIIQVAAGYADVALEFAKGFATYDILPGLFIAEQAGITILDLEGKPLTSRLDIDRILDGYRRDPKNPERVKFVAAKNPRLAQEVVELLDV